MTRKINNNENFGVLLILISTLGYGLMPIFSFFAYKFNTDVSTLLFTRFFLTSSILWFYIIITKKDYKISFSHFLFLMFIGILGYSLASITLYSAYKIISVSIATLILFSHPVFVIIIEKFIFKKTLTKNKLISLFLTLIGLFIVLYEKDSILNTKGILLSFIASLAYALFCIGLSEKRTQKLSGIVVTAYITSIATFINFIRCIFLNAPFFPNTQIGILNGFNLAIFSTLIAAITFYEGLSIIGPTSATLISTFEPIFVMILSALFLHEVLKINVLFGGIILIFAVIILDYKQNSKNF